jgi:hypothetical protein
MSLYRILEDGFVKLFLTQTVELEDHNHENKNEELFKMIVDILYFHMIVEHFLFYYLK